MSKRNKRIYEMRRTIANNIHKYRIKKNLQLEKLSTLTGIPLWKLDFFEMGKSHMELGQLLKIADILEVSPAKLCEQVR